MVLMEKDPITKLHIEYVDDRLDKLSYEDEHNKILAHISGMKMNKDTLSNYWEVIVNNSDSTIKIAANYITMDNIRRLQASKRSMKVVTFETAEESNIQNMTYAIHLSKIPGKDIALIFDAKYSIIIEDNEVCTIVKVKNIETDKFEETHYIDDKIYMVTNLIENSESIYIGESNIKYEFKLHNLSISNYLQYHQPYRVTNYTTNKQYILEYDDHGIMKSMIDISNPNDNLCTYFIEDTIVENNKNIISIHPDVYNPMDRHHILQNFIDSDVVVIESYIDFFPEQASSYKRYTINKNNIVVD